MFYFCKDGVNLTGTSLCPYNVFLKSTGIVIMMDNNFYVRLFHYCYYTYNLQYKLTFFIAIISFYSSNFFNTLLLFYIL